MTPHTCHAPGCRAVVPPKAFACGKHWFMLPAPYRHALLSAYREGQERDKRPSREYLDAAKAARAWFSRNVEVVNA